LIVNTKQTHKAMDSESLRELRLVAPPFAWKWATPQRRQSAPVRSHPESAWSRRDFRSLLLQILTSAGGADTAVNHL